MTGSNSDAQRWRDWVRKIVDSVGSLDGESGLEFCESVALELAREQQQDAAEANTVSELIVAGFVVAFEEAAAEALLDVQRPRSGIEQILREGLEDHYRLSEPWVTEGLSAEEIASKLAAYQIEMERHNARVKGLLPERPQPMDFDALLEAQGSETRMIIYEIAGVVSAPLFAFMLNVPSANVHDHIPNDTQREVIGELISLLRMLPGYRYELAHNAIEDELIKYDPMVGTSKATYFHIKCGGDRPGILDDGSLDSALKIIAMDFVGARLGNESSLMAVLPSHPLHRELIYRVMSEDEPITELFRNAVEADTSLGESQRQMLPMYLPQVIAHWTDGSGGSVAIRHVPESLLSALNLTCDTSNGVLQKVCDAVDESLTLARKLATGESATTVALVGLANVTLDEDVERIDLPGMHIRPPSVFEKVPYATKPTAVAEVATELRMVDVAVQKARSSDDRMEMLREFTAERERLKAYGGERSQSSESITERILQLRFAMALASQQRRLIGPIWLYTVYRNPLTGWGGNSLRPSSDIDSAFSEQVIDRITAARIADYFVPTASLHPSLRLGRTRILQALSDRSDAMDSFIDFVIAWESMVGYSENTTFLVSAAMSLLLSPEDVEKRKELFSRIRKLYGNRSALVHGSAGPDLQTKSFKIADARDYANQAGRLAIDTFKRILLRPELMNLDSQERVKMVLLGFPK